jgi:MYXO-CTERM domain-containing protein
VPAGSAGLVATNQPTDAAPLWIGAAFLVLAGLAGAALLRRRVTVKAGL